MATLRDALGLGDAPAAAVGVIRTEAARAPKPEATDDPVDYDECNEVAFDVTRPTKGKGKRRSKRRRRAASNIYTDEYWGKSVEKFVDRKFRGKVSDAELFGGKDDEFFEIYRDTKSKRGSRAIAVTNDKERDELADADSGAEEDVIEKKLQSQYMDDGHSVASSGVGSNTSAAFDPRLRKYVSNYAKYFPNLVNYEMEVANELHDVRAKADDDVADDLSSIHTSDVEREGEMEALHINIRTAINAAPAAVRAEFYAAEDSVSLVTTSEEDDSDGDEESDFDNDSDGEDESLRELRMSVLHTAEILQQRQELLAACKESGEMRKRCAAQVAESKDSLDLEYQEFAVQHRAVKGEVAPTLEELLAPEEDKSSSSSSSVSSVSSPNTVSSPSSSDDDD